MLPESTLCCDRPFALRLLSCRWTGLLPLAGLILVFPVLDWHARALAQQPVNASIRTDDDPPAPQPPAIEAASNEGKDAIAQFRFDSKLQCQLFAAEPDVANVVAFHRDYQGRVFACETFRQERGVEDNRNHGHWMDEELAAQTVQDRIDYILKYVPDAKQSYTEQDDRIRQLLDTDGDGQADQSTVFSDRYNRLEMGTGAGVLSYRDQVYYTCIPDLFLLKDTNGNGIADDRTSLQTGYGVRFAFRGHDMHGLIVGPDGRLYFSIGDRGYNVSPEIKDATSGAVFRCELDGSKLEVVATGLRNPQELAFDDFGNLFTGDNNSDSGDKARFTEIIRGADSGWRMYYQYLPDRGPFNRERIWEPYNQSTPAYILPPITNISDGPSGLEFYPGTGFGPEFDGRFFLCDFRGGAANSGIRSFKHELQGASWKLTDLEEPFWNMLVTDLDFGSDGRLYVSDWVFGWTGTNKGRIYSFTDPSYHDSELVREVESLLREGLQDQPEASLVSWLGHSDRRVRQEAQFDLVRREATATLSQLAADLESPEMARIHALWGLAQLARTRKLAPAALDDLWKQITEEASPRVNIAAIRLAGELKRPPLPWLQQHLANADARVAFESAMALNRIGTEAQLDAVVARLVANADQDPTLRHGLILALQGLFERSHNPATSKVANLIGHESASVRRATCVALRKTLSSNQPNTYRAKQAAAKLVGQLLEDDDSSIVLEAARVIHDVPVASQMPALAAKANQIDSYANVAPLVRRILNACYRVGAKTGAESLAAAAASSELEEGLRRDAVVWLGRWLQPPSRDAILNDWRPIKTRRNPLDAQTALKSVFVPLLESSDAIAQSAITSAGQINLTSIGEDLIRVARSTTAREQSRVAALRSLDRLKNPELGALLTELAESPKSLSSELKATVIDLVAQRNAAAALPLIQSIIADGKRPAQQSVIATLGRMEDAGSAELLARCLRAMRAQKFAAALRLDVIMAIENRKDPTLKAALAQYHGASINPEKIASRFTDTLEGGRASAGRQVFFEKTEVSCVRCHKIKSKGGDVGPNLSDVGLKNSRQYLLEAIVDPNLEIAKGFAQTKVLTVDGQLLVGLVKEDTEEMLVLLDADGKRIEIPQDDIEDTLPGPSSMPTDLHQKLTASEIRDLVAFLANQKSSPDEAGDEHE